MIIRTILVEYLSTDGTGLDFKFDIDGNTPLDYDRDDDGGLFFSGGAYIADVESILSISTEYKLLENTGE